MEADSITELNDNIRKLQDNNSSRGSNREIAQSNLVTEYPSLSGNLGCAAAMRELLSSEWGKREPRNEHELTLAMRSNALHFPHGTIAGLLNALTKRGELRRVGKKNGSYAYAIVPKSGTTKESREVLLTA